MAVTVRDALDPTNPRPGEIDLRFRERLPVRPRPDLGIAQLIAGEDGDQLGGRTGSGCASCCARSG